MRRGENLTTYEPTVLKSESLNLLEASEAVQTYKGTALLLRGLELLIVATIYLQLIQNRYMFRSFTVLHCSHQHCVQPVASDVEVVGYL